MNPNSHFILMALLAVAGWAFSFYFLRVLDGKMNPSAWWIPTVFRMSEGGCQILVETTYGRILGKPNAFWGNLYYPFILIIFGLSGAELIDRSLLLIPVLFAMILSLYLLWGLYRLRTLCPACFATHTVNFLILILAWRTL